MYVVEELWGNFSVELGRFYDFEEAEEVYESRLNEIVEEFVEDEGLDEEKAQELATSYLTIREIKNSKSL